MEEKNDFFGFTDVWLINFHRFIILPFYDKWNDLLSYNLFGKLYYLFDFR